LVAASEVRRRTRSAYLPIGSLAEGCRIRQSVRVSSDGSERKRKNVRFLQRYVLNPPTMLAVRLGLVRGHVLIETFGHRTGKRRRNVVGMQIEDSTGWVVAEQGLHAGYVRNIEANPRVRVCVRGKWRTAVARIVGDDDAQARLDSFGRPGHAANVRRFGTDLLTVRFDFAGA
jgi:deazaflavin-dependent oxidoreductase (nitroreductase family)